MKSNNKTMINYIMPGKFGILIRITGLDDKDKDADVTFMLST